jgi:hypothetical protein
VVDHEVRVLAVYFSFFDVPDGKIALLREIMNPLQLLKTIGGSITMPAAAPRY